MWISHQPSFRNCKPSGSAIRFSLPSVARAEAPEEPAVRREHLAEPHLHGTHPAYGVHRRARREACVLQLDAHEMDLDSRPVIVIESLDAHGRPDLRPHAELF